MLKTTMLASSMLVHVLDGLLGMMRKEKVFRSWLFLASSLKGRRTKSSSSPATERMPPANSIPFPFEKSEDSPEDAADGPTPAYGRRH